MSTPCSCAMKPRTENIAKPDTKLVPLLRPPSSKQSLCHTYVMEVVNEHRRNRGSHFFSFSRNRLWHELLSLVQPPPPQASQQRVGSPVAVVFVFVVAPQRSHCSQAYGVGEEDLGPRVDPHLRTRATWSKECSALQTNSESLISVSSKCSSMYLRAEFFIGRKIRIRHFSSRVWR